MALAIGPALESTFGHVTRLTMSEWLSYDHPLLRELAAAAPGTFQHSVNGEPHSSRLSTDDLVTIQVAVSRALHAMYHQRQLAYPIDRPAKPRLVSRWFGDRRSTG